MYILKNAYTNVIRGKSKNILIGLIIFIVVLSATITLSINGSAKKLVNKYKESNPLEVSFRLERGSLREATSEDRESFKSITEEQINSFANSKYVKDYYYTNETSLSSNDIEAINDNNLTKEKENDDNSMRPKMNMGDFRLTGYSDSSYIQTFIDGTNKITSGKMFSKNSTDKVIVISEDLAKANDLKVGDKITFYNPNDEDIKYELEVIGIYKDTSTTSDNNFMGMNAMNSSNQIYTNISTINEISSDSSNNHMSGLNAKFYLTNNNKLNAFKKEVKSKGLSSYYSIETNEEEALAAVKPIQNIKNFSITFLIIMVIVGALVVTILNLINIRERKYEIGVLRSIGMSKRKLSLQILLETIIVSVVALVVGLIFGITLSQPITNKMLKSEIASIKNESTRITENFGGNGFEREGFKPNGMHGGPDRNKNNNVEYVNSLDVNISIYTIGELCLVVLILVTASGIVSVLIISRFEPNKILQSR